MRNRTVIVDIETKHFKSLTYKQFDKNNELNIIVYRDEEVVDISGCTATVYFELPSGRIYKIDGVVKSNTINVILSDKILKEYGQVDIEVELDDGKQTTTSFMFYLNVEKSIFKDGANDTNIEEHIHENKEILDNITQEKIDEWNNKLNEVIISISQIEESIRMLENQLNNYSMILSELTNNNK